MNEQNISGNVPPTQPVSREPSFSDLYRETDADQEQEEPEEEPGETRGKRPRVSRLERLQQKKHELERQISALEAKEKQKDRKIRTRRLIELGAIAEKYLKCEGIEPQKFEAFLKGLVEQPEVKRHLRKE
jgi:hypothetical protein